MVTACTFVLLAVVFAVTNAVTRPVSLHLEGETRDPIPPTLPFFLGGNPADEQVHDYSVGVGFAPHTAQGKALHHANVGRAASFEILLADEKDAPPHDEWNAVSNKLFIYVWIANADQIFIAEVVNNGDGTLKATYESLFPGNYSVHIEVVTRDEQDEGVPIVGSPFALTVEGEPSLDIDALPVCGTEQEDIASSFWRPGTWVSSNLASASHGVMRDGWVFQPKSCVYDTFSYEDLMLLAEKTEPTWILILGGSVQRGVFLTLVDMALAQGKKDNIGGSAIGKCWGYADIQIGNLRLTYQDFRLYTIHEVEDATVCNNEKLKSGSTASFVRSCKHFLEWQIFQEGTDWPSVILAPYILVHRNTAANVDVEGTRWDQQNPTRTALEDIVMTIGRSHPGGDNGYGEMSRHEEQDPRTTFMSIFPMYQSKLFENANTRDGKRWYGGNQHLHYIASNSSTEAYSGAMMVHSSMTEMIYNMCTDCPSSLLPFHVQPRPRLVCTNVSALPGNAPICEVWNQELCPEWCLATTPVSQTQTGSGLVDVRSCPVNVPQP